MLHRYNDVILNKFSTVIYYAMLSTILLSFRGWLIVRCFINAIFKNCIFLCFLFVSHSALASPIKITFINPAYPNEVFWEMVTSFMQSAANDLEIELRVLYSHQNRMNSLEIAKEILNADEKPDYLIFHFQAQVGSHILQAAEKEKVYSFVFNTNTPKADKLDIGVPRGKYKYWLGHMFPNDENAGFLLSSALVNKAIQEGRVDSRGKVQIIGLTGTNESRAALDRNRGLERFTEQRSDVELHQIVDASWDRAKANYATGILLSRYPDTSVVWAASDEMSFGAIQMIEQKGLNPGIDMFTGGFDWTPDGLKAVKSGKMTATIGGHFMEGAWVMVLLHDHYHGLDFAESIGTIIRSKMKVITSSNVQPYLKMQQTMHWNNIDFKSYSKKYNRKLKTYDFSLPNMPAPN
jgi:ABC-type sugar transport system substrate-binding protein